MIFSYNFQVGNDKMTLNDGMPSWKAEQPRAWIYILAAFVSFILDDLWFSITRSAIEVVGLLIYEYNTSVCKRFRTWFSATSLAMV